MPNTSPHSDTHATEPGLTTTAETTQSRPFTTIRNWELISSGLESMNYDYCPPIMGAEMPEPGEDKEEDLVPCIPMGDCG